MSAPVWTCPSCATAVVSHFCPSCGERSPDERELTLHGLASQIFQSLTSIDGKLLRSFMLLMSRPGDLTVAYLEGQRKPFIGPVPLYLMANVLFFATESLLGGAVLSTTLANHLSRQPWSVWAPTLVAHRVNALGTTLDAYAPLFDRALTLHARSWIILMALAFAVFPWLAFHGRKKPFAAHAVFSLHLYSFLLVLMSVADIVPALDHSDGQVFVWRVVDNAVSVLLLVACGIYVYIATEKVYAARGVTRIAKVVVLTVGMGAIVLAYRFALFALTLYTAA
jgi:hypothetical protein